MKTIRGVLINLYKSLRDPRNARWYISALSTTSSGLDGTV